MFSKGLMDEFTAGCSYPPPAQTPPDHFVRIGDSNVVSYMGHASSGDPEFQRLALLPNLTPQSKQFVSGVTADMFDKVCVDGQFLWLTTLCVNSDRNTRLYGPLFCTAQGWRLKLSGEQFHQCEYFKRVSGNCEMDAISGDLPPQYMDWLIQQNKLSPKASAALAKQKHDLEERQALLQLDTQPLVGHREKRKQTQARAARKRPTGKANEVIVLSDNDEYVEDVPQDDEEHVPGVHFSVPEVSGVRKIEARGEQRPVIRERRPLVDAPPMFTCVDVIVWGMNKVLSVRSESMIKHWLRHPYRVHQHYATLKQARASKEHCDAVTPLLYCFLHTLAEKYNLLPVVADSSNDRCIKLLRQQIDDLEHHRAWTPAQPINALELLNMGVPQQSMKTQDHYSVVDSGASLLADIVERRSYTVQSMEQDRVTPYLKKHDPTHWLIARYQTLELASKNPNVEQLGMPLVFGIIRHSMSLYHIQFVTRQEAESALTTEQKLELIAQLKTQLNRLREAARQARIHPQITQFRPQMTEAELTRQQLLFGDD